MAPVLTLADFDYELPPDCIADRPAAARDKARLLLLAAEGMSHYQIADLPALLSAHVGAQTLLVLNDTKVLPARVRGYKVGKGGAGGRVEALLITPTGHKTRQHWRAMYKSSKPLRAGQMLELVAPKEEERYAVGVVESKAGEVVLDFGDLDAARFSVLLERLGEIPLPPYIERSRQRLGLSASTDEDRQRYQTVYARDAGSVAAPTAGLHFTKELLLALQAAGHDYVSVTLHVGPGTFLPVRSDSLHTHVMHAERYHISESSAATIAAARAAGRPVLAVGTTVVRTLESATAEGHAAPRPGWGETQLFIYPPYKFRAVDALLTNFHLPRSTLLMLVSAFAGQKRIEQAYKTAIGAGYRFYSFGDAMLISQRGAKEELHVQP